MRNKMRVSVSLTALVVLWLVLARMGYTEDADLFFSYLPQGKSAPFYVANQNGFYKDVNLTVKLHRGYGSGDNIKKVATGADFGEADAASLVVARSQGVKVREVAMLHDKSLSVVFFLKGSGIRQPKDLEGKHIGDVVGGGARVTFPAFAAANGIDVSKVTWVNLSAASKVPSLLQKKVDAISDFALDLPVIKKLQKKQNVQVDQFMYGEHGVDTYSNGIVAKDSTIREQPEKVRRFVHASMKAVLWSLEHPREAIDIYMKANPTADSEITWGNWEIFVDHLLTETAAEMGLGYMTREKMEFTRDILTKHMGLKTTVPVEDLYTNEFLPKLFFRRK